MQAEFMRALAGHCALQMKFASRDRPSDSPKWTDIHLLQQAQMTAAAVPDRMTSK
jgi:hypothetical protein